MKASDIHTMDEVRLGEVPTPWSPSSEQGYEQASLLLTTAGLFTCGHRRLKTFVNAFKNYPTKEKAK